MDLSLNPFLDSFQKSTRRSLLRRHDAFSQLSGKPQELFRYDPLSLFLEGGQKFRLKRARKLAGQLYCRC